MTTYGVFDSAGNLLYVPAGAMPVPAASTGHQVAALPDGYSLSANAYTLVSGTVTATALDPMIALRAAAVTSAQSQYDQPIAAGYTYSGTLYQIDTDSQTQIAAMGALALGSITDPANSPWPSGFTWIATNNSQTAMDAPTMYAFARAVAVYVSGCILNLRAIKNALAASTTQAALAAVSVTTGYPAASS